MSRVELVVCEKTSRWAAALRMALVAVDVPCQLFETRRRAELEAELSERPNSIAAIEVQREDVADILEWLPRARELHTSVRFVALVDHSLAADDAACDALFEAGVDAVVTSPRRVGPVIELARRQAKMPAIVDEEEPITARVLASLPWQRR